MEPAMEDKNDVDSSSSDSSNPCAICLGPVQQESYLDQCFHRFYYDCILRWSKVANSRHSEPPSTVNCPLCKSENISIIHGYDGICFQQHYISDQYVGNTTAFFSKFHKYRLQCYYDVVKSGTTALLAEKFNLSQYWKSNKYLQPNRWVFDWLKREIQALTEDEDVDIIVHHVHGSLSSMKNWGKVRRGSSTKTIEEEFKVLVSEAARPYLGRTTDSFAEELELFLASGLNIEAYDKVYSRHLGLKNPKLTNEEDDEEDDGDSD